MVGKKIKMVVTMVGGCNYLQNVREHRNDIRSSTRTLRSVLLKGWGVEMIKLGSFIVSHAINAIFKYHTCMVHFPDRQ